jgi:hypothetical protein
MADDLTSENIELQKASNSIVSSAKSFVSGGVGGVCAILVGHPFDLIKTRLQTAHPGEYKGTLDVVSKTLKADGFKGLYRGMGPPLIGVTPIFALSFWAYDLGKKLVYAATPNRTSDELNITELSAAGFFSAIPTVLVAGPAERIKVLLQLQGQSGSGPKYNGPMDVVRQLYKEGGLRSIFRGTGGTLARDGPGSAAYVVPCVPLTQLLCCLRARQARAHSWRRCIAAQHCLDNRCWWSRWYGHVGGGHSAGCGQVALPGRARGHVPRLYGLCS